MKLCFKKIKQILRPFLLSALLFHGGTQTYYWLNHFYHWHMPSSKRIEFERRYGFPILGWSEDIEENEANLSLIAEVLEKERKKRSFDLTSIRIKSNNYLKKPLWDQFAELFLSAYPVYNLKGRAVVESFNLASILHHEIKHVKINDITESHPEFLKKWKELARGDNGECLYLSYTEQVYVSVKGLESLADGKKQDFSKNRRLGFVSNYARKNVYEDIAELCTLAEINPWEFHGWLFGAKGEENERIKGKVQLAQKYRLIRKDFTELVRQELVNSERFAENSNN